MLTNLGARVVYEQYCPRHEFEWWECCACCAEWRADMWQVDTALRAYWYRHGYLFTKRWAA